MGCYRLQVEKVGKNREEATVLLHLISKAERRKRAAENFHVYAMLQSTILRLKLDDHVVKMRNLTYRNKRCMSTNFSSSIDGSLIKRFPDVSVSDVTDVCTIDKDPLNLDSFFDKLKASNQPTFLFLGCFEIEILCKSVITYCGHLIYPEIYNQELIKPTAAEFVELVKQNDLLIKVPAKKNV